jgi:hypothetical protein
MAKCPVSLFDSVKNNKPTDFELIEFDGFVSLMTSFADEKFGDKDDAPLVCLTKFTGNLRRKSNATGSGLVVLDIDDHLTIDDVDLLIREVGVAALLCSTASHRLNQHKFRVFVPLLDVADYQPHVHAWHAINEVLANSLADPSKIGCESMFYVPGKYPNAPAVFEHYSGLTLSAAEWIELVGGEGHVSELAGNAVRTETSSTAKGVSRTVRPMSSASDADLDLYRTKLVTDKALDAYRQPQGSYHHARFALLLSMAGRARRMNVNVASNDLLTLFNQIDLEDGGHYQSQDNQKALLVEAQKAISS